MNGILSILIICISEFLTAFFYLFVITVRLFARFISYALMIAAVFAFTADVTRWQIGDTKPLFYSLVQHANSISPNTLNELTIIFKGYLHSAVWNYAILIMVSIPAWLIFVLVGYALVLAGSEQRHVNIYSN
ncbi:MAG: hypothetical protein HRT83_02395 [Hyphomicrobiaceae bacterium]|nr:hypothetical protein [Hyphomicrobiaceae bacterium]